MNNLQKKIKMHCVVFYSKRYWNKEDEIKMTIRAIKEKLETALLKFNIETKIITIKEEKDINILNNIEKEGIGLFIPISGSVQPWAFKAAEYFKTVSVCGAYVPGFVQDEITKLIVEKNAAPAVMEIYSMLKRKDQMINWFKSFDELVDLYKAVLAVNRLENSNLLLIGDTENWVLSSTKDREIIKKRLGINLLNISLNALEKKYTAVDDMIAQEEAEKWSKNALSIIEPVKKDIVEASRLSICMNNLINEYDLSGIAIGCFKMLNRFGTTSCLALSRLNDSINCVGACEGDLDSAITMMLMKAISNKPAFMANPMIMNENIIKLVHCSAPCCITGENSPYILRNHHESGIGVSPEVQLPFGESVTLCRLGAGLSTVHVLKGETVKTNNINTCRTQIDIKLDSMSAYIENVLGCHISITYGIYERILKYWAKITGVKLS